MMRGWRAWAGAMLLAGAVPLQAQQFVSDSYSFLKAVRDRDGTKATELLDKPATTIIQGRDSNTGETALHIVTRRRDLTWMNFMLGKGADINARDRDGMTALAIAAQLGWAEGVQDLLTYGANVDLPNNQGETPLILATEAHSLPVVRALITQGADPRIADHVAGLSAIDYATRDPRSAVILKVLQEAKPKTKKAVAGPGING
ncbi:ankyrin repeat domain-containing protein [Sphingomonas morindae]|uniref:Ankyrin repeat domain-containing protein n=1 Tax=Sphingomonas morindae TaxID=1541170 RepID=A0ABY4XBJ0_9SPHN|nr:ankyrin repeat domain-containing protein [Sphingomonas morindae]USI74249.1 ankyrin repeat domain-containing protein [Sphingomonas morindae]